MKREVKRVQEKHNKAKELEQLDRIVTDIKNAPNFEVSSKKPRNNKEYIEYDDNGKKRYIYAINK